MKFVYFPLDRDRLISYIMGALVQQHTVGAGLNQTE